MKVTGDQNPIWIAINEAVNHVLAAPPKGSHVAPVTDVIERQVLAMAIGTAAMRALQTSTARRWVGDPSGPCWICQRAKSEHDKDGLCPAAVARTADLAERHQIELALMGEGTEAATAERDAARAEVDRLRSRPTLTVERARKVVLSAIRTFGVQQTGGYFIEDNINARDLDAIIDRAAKELAGAAVDGQRDTEFVALRKALHARLDDVGLLHPVVVAAEAWRDGASLNSGTDPQAAVDYYRAQRKIAPAFDHAATTVTHRPAAELTARLNDAVRSHPDRRFDDSDVHTEHLDFGPTDDQRTSTAPLQTMAEVIEDGGPRPHVESKDGDR